MARFLVLWLVMLGGCGGALCDFELTSHETEACRMNASYEQHQHALRDREHARKRADAGEARVARDAAAPACAAGDPRACLTVATYDDAHGGDARAIERAYAVACDGKLAFGCFGAGEYAADARLASRALPLYARGCALGEARACEAAAAMDVSRATAFHEAACTARDYAACERAGFAYRFGANAPLDVARGNALLATACAHGATSACTK